MKPWFIGNPSPIRPTFTIYDRPFGLGDVAEVYDEEDARKIAKLPQIIDVLERLTANAATSFGPAADERTVLEHGKERLHLVAEARDVLAQAGVEGYQRTLT